MTQDELRSEATTRIQASGLLENIPKWTPPGSPTSWWPASPGPGAGYPEDTIVGAKEQAQAANDNSISQYYHLADNWVRSNTAGRVSPTGWPIVPNCAGIQFFGDTWAMVPGIGSPVCNPLTQPADNSGDEATRFNQSPLNTEDIGTAIESGATVGYFHLGPNDRTKIGHTSVGTSADGVSGAFTRVGTPVSQWSGPRAVYGGYYLKEK